MALRLCTQHLPAVVQYDDEGDFSKIQCPVCRMVSENKEAIRILDADKARMESVIQAQRKVLDGEDFAKLAALEEKLKLYEQDFPAPLWKGFKAALQTIKGRDDETYDSICKRIAEDPSRYRFIDSKWDEFLSDVMGEMGEMEMSDFIEVIQHAMNLLENVDLDELDDLIGSCSDIDRLKAGLDAKEKLDEVEGMLENIKSSARELWENAKEAYEAI